jgi:hypothetical protein
MIRQEPILLKNRPEVVPFFRDLRFNLCRRISAQMKWAATRWG